VPEESPKPLTKLLQHLVRLGRLIAITSARRSAPSCGWLAEQPFAKFGTPGPDAAKAHAWAPPASCASSSFGRDSGLREPLSERRPRFLIATSRAEPGTSGSLGVQGKRRAASAWLRAPAAGDHQHSPGLGIRAISASPWRLTSSGGWVHLRLAVTTSNDLSGEPEPLDDSDAKLDGEARPCRLPRAQPHQGAPP